MIDTFLEAIHKTLDWFLHPEDRDEKVILVIAIVGLAYSLTAGD